MRDQTRKFSEIMKEMAQTLFRKPDAEPSSAAAHVALCFANVAWNECVGIDGAREVSRGVWETIEAENPQLWNEFKSNDVNAMIDELVRYKKKKYPDDRRRILVCGMRAGNVHVEWMNAAVPGVDASWELTLYGLARVGKQKEAIHFLTETRGMTPKEASDRVSKIAAELGVK